MARIGRKVVTADQMIGRLNELLGKPLRDERRVAELSLVADSGVRLTWQRFDLNDQAAGWQNRK